jgi:hypothetical protein
MAEPSKECFDVMKRIAAAIEDEKKAGPEYHELANDTREMFCGGECPKGLLAQIGLEQLATDEAKHHDFLVELLSAVVTECRESPKVMQLPPLPLPVFPPMGEETFIDGSKTVKLKLSRKSDTDEWVVRYYENGKLDDDKSYYTNDKKDAQETMESMKRRLRQGLPWLRSGYTNP